MPPLQAGPNTTSLAAYKGVISPCPHCSTTDAKLSQSACQYCMSRRYLAKCMACVDGMLAQGSAWDSGRSQYRSTCPHCGGRGFYPASESDFIRQQATNPVAVETQSPAISNRPLPRVVMPINELNITRYPKS